MKTIVKTTTLLLGVGLVGVTAPASADFRGHGSYRPHAYAFRAEIGARAFHRHLRYLRHHRHRLHRRHHSGVRLFFGAYPWYPLVTYFGYGHRYYGNHYYGNRYYEDRYYGDRYYGRRTVIRESLYAADPPRIVAPPRVIFDAPARRLDARCAVAREYQTTLRIGGREVPGYGTACRQPDGSWRLGPATATR